MCLPVPVSHAIRTPSARSRHRRVPARFPARLLRRLPWRQRRLAAPPDAGMTTAEYAIGTVAACAFAAILYRVVTSGAVSGVLAGLLDRALHAV